MKFKQRRSEAMKKHAKKWWIDVFPTLTELKISKDLGMSPDGYCKTLNDADEYERQIAKEAAALRAL